MAIGIIESYFKINLLLIFLSFFIQGFSIPTDTVKKQNCPNGFLIQVNGNFRCIDTTDNYYPILTERWCATDSFFFMKKSINLQILEEPMWYGENIQDDRLRIYLIEYSPGYDSIVLFSLFRQNYNDFKLIKKEMPVFHNISYVVDNNNFPKGKYVFDIIGEPPVINYKQSEFIVPEKKMMKLIKYLNALKKCGTFDQYDSWSPAFVIEYCLAGNYHLIVAPEPQGWGGLLPEFKLNEKNCRRKDGLKIMKWLSEY
ncbi:MAG: hypothetical protein FWC10_02795 [Lentimicrobiaceae bacterium]|nr:hypothetical protein [Lentimicrobiaceae bacterium]